MAFLLLLFFLGLCRDRPDSAGRQVPDGADAVPPAPGPKLVTLSGLYESGRLPASRLCVVAAGKQLRFGLVVRESGSRSCSGSGFVSRERGGLRFAMAGDSACTVRATIAGRTIVFASKVPSGCAYYCGTGASLAGARLIQVSARRAAAMKATDLVGEPLCAEE